MAHLEDLRRIAETLPGAAVGENGFLAVRTSSEEQKHELVTDAWRLRAPERLQKEAGR